MSPRLGGAAIRSVLFDYGLTLVTFSRPDASLQRAYTDIAARIAGRLGIDPPDAATLVTQVHDRVDAAIARHAAAASLEEIDVAEVYREAYASLDVALPDEGLDEVQRIEQEAWLDGVTVVAEAPEVLARLRSAGLRLGLCSNAPYRTASMRAQLVHVGLAPLLDSATFSGAVGWRKPSPRIIESALRDLRADAATTVMVGDSMEEDIAAAHASGLRGVLVGAAASQNSADAVIERLGDLPELLGVA